VEEKTEADIDTIDVSQYQPKNVLSLTWCECIKKIWKDDPLICPDCAGRMRIIAFITAGPIIRKILKHLCLWDEERDSQLRKAARDPPPKPEAPKIVWIPIENAFSTRFLYANGKR